MLLGFALAASAASELRLAGLFSDHMVLQEGRPVAIWGWARPGERVTIQFAGQTISTLVANNGAWQATLPPLASSAQGRVLQVQSGDVSLSLADVLVGEVWHASGQSNMEMTMGAVAQRLGAAARDIQEAQFPALRFRRINERPSEKPWEDLPVGAGWKVCSPETVVTFSAAAFYFARALHQELGRPVAVLDSSRGGTPIEPFIPRGAFDSHPTLRRELELGDQNDLAGLARLPGGVRARDAHWLPGRLFHSRVAPLTNFPVRGVIWYQGESNCGVGEDPRDYEHKMRALIQGWRGALGTESLPFYFVQLPGSGAGPGWPYLREQQRLSSNLPQTGMVTTIDLLDHDIHPPNKFDVGLRLARWALAGPYGRDLVPCGPMFKNASLSEGSVTVSFDYAEGGLMAASKVGLAAPREIAQRHLPHFELADEHGRWHAADAVIDGETVVVRIPPRQKPVAVRYAYEVSPQDCRLYNRDGLPASPFCSRPDLLPYDPGWPAD